MRTRFVHSRCVQSASVFTCRRRRCPSGDRRDADREVALGGGPGSGSGGRKDAASGEHACRTRTGLDTARLQGRRTEAKQQAGSCEHTP